MEWQLGSLVAFANKAWFITAIVTNRETGEIRYTLNNACRRYEFITVVRK